MTDDSKEELACAEKVERGSIAFLASTAAFLVSIFGTLFSFGFFMKDFSDPHHAIGFNLCIGTVMGANLLGLLFLVFCKVRIWWIYLIYVLLAAILTSGVFGFEVFFGMIHG